MLTVEQAQDRIAELEAEAATLEAAERELAAQRQAADAKSATAGVASERTPSPANSRAADQADAAARLLVGQHGRKQAALQAVRDDLDKARANLELAKKAATVVELEAFYSELVDIAASLDDHLLGNARDAAEWERMALILHLGNNQYQTVKPEDTTYYRTIFVAINLVYDRVMAKYQTTIAKRIQIGPNPRQFDEIKFDTVGDALELDMLRRQLDYLRRVHITAHEQAPAPVLEAVPA